MSTFSIALGDDQRDKLLQSGCPKALLDELESRSDWTTDSLASTIMTHMLRLRGDHFGIGDHIILLTVPEGLKDEAQHEYDSRVGGHMVFQGSAEAQWMMEDLANERRRQSGEPPIRRGPL